LARALVYSALFLTALAVARAQSSGTTTWSPTGWLASGNIIWSERSAIRHGFRVAKDGQPDDERGNGAGCPDWDHHEWKRVARRTDYRAGTGIFFLSGGDNAGVTLNGSSFQSSAGQLTSSDEQVSVGTYTIGVKALDPLFKRFFGPRGTPRVLVASAGERREATPTATGDPACLHALSEPGDCRREGDSGRPHAADAEESRPDSLRKRRSL